MLSSIMEWIRLENTETLEEIVKQSSDKPVVIFKHSTHCSISSLALNRLDRDWNAEEMNNINAYYLDLITYRQISNQIAADFQVPHQSPQVLIIKDGKCIYDTSHMGISYAAIKMKIQELSAQN